MLSGLIDVGLHEGGGETSPCSKVPRRSDCDRREVEPCHIGSPSGERQGVQPKMALEVGNPPAANVANLGCFDGMQLVATGQKAANIVGAGFIPRVEGSADVPA